jgi:hypothetical protein
MGAADVHLEGANLGHAHLERAALYGAHLEGAYLRDAHLEGAYLYKAHLERADLRDAHLEGANLGRVSLAGTDLGGAHLAGTDLYGARLDEDTSLQDVILGPGFLGDWLDRLRFRNRNASLSDVKWRDADLTDIPWGHIRRLGDERDATPFLSGDGFLSPLSHQDVVRAYRQVATRLRAQGMAEDADRFAYRAQIRQRGVLWRSGRLPQWLFSWALYLLAGYGYRPSRTLFWYLAVIAAFTFMYMQATSGWIPFGLPAPSALAPLPWYEALILSVSSFHGRGFFQPLQSLGDPVAALAAIEAVMGLFIEISFIATFTQRYFGGR